MPTIVAAKTISNQSIFVRHKTKNCFAKFTKHQECGT
jgi:hypothetical protein